MIVLSFLRALPAKFYGWLLVILLALASIAAFYHYAERRGEVKIQRIARADSTRTAIAKKDTVVAKQAVHVAASKATGKVRTALRERVRIIAADTLIVDGRTVPTDSTVVALIKADDAHIAAADSAIALIPAVEAAHAAVDTALTHQIDAGDSAERGGHGKAIAVTLAVVGTLGALWALLHH